MFNLEYIAASLGVNVESGGLSVMEEELTVGGVGGNVSLSQTPVAFDGTMIGWYKKPSDVDWQIGTIAEKVMTIPGSQANDHYCVKYFYLNENAKSIVIKTQYVPAELHVVIMNDLFSGDIADISSGTRYGRLITDIPRLQMAGNQNLALTATGAATVALTGSALAVSTSNTCEEDPYYGTMTEEIYGQKWQDDVLALALENPEIALTTGQKETLIVRVVYKGNMPSQRKDNSNFTFTVEVGDTTDTSVTAGTGEITAGSTPGTAYVTIALTDYDDVPTAIAEVTVTA